MGGWQFFLDQEGLAGGGAVLCSFESNIKQTLSFELNHLGINKSDLAELWAAVYALRTVKPESLGRIISDNSTVISSMEKVRTGQALPYDMEEGLKAQLTLAVLAQPHMVIQRIKDGKNRPRGQGKTPIADDFAKAAARGDEAGIEKVIRRYGHHPHQHFPSPQ